MCEGTATSARAGGEPSWFGYRFTDTPWRIGWVWRESQFGDLRQRCVGGERGGGPS